MPEIVEVYLSASGGLNTEDSPHSPPAGTAGHSLYEAGDYLYALNARIGASFGTNAGAVENIPSMLLIDNYYQWNGSDWIAGTPPTGTNTALGKYEDNLEGKVYWCVKNSNGNDAILMYVKSEQKIYELLQWVDLDFSGNFMSMTKINKFLIFTDGNPDDETGMPPRMIDVTTIFELFATLNTNFSEYHLSFAKWAPVDPPTIEPFDNQGNVFIKKGIRQFAYRLIYKGGFRSCFSPPSYFVTNEQLISPNINKPTPITGFSWNWIVKTPGFVFDFNDAMNTAFDYTSPKFYEVVDSIEFAYRESQTATWKVFERVTVDGTMYGGETVFYDNGPSFDVAQSDIGQYFDAVPHLSRAVEAIDNRPMFGNNLDDLPPMDDFDVTDIEVYSVQMTEDNWYQDYAPLAPELAFRRMSFKENGVYKLGIIFKDYAGRSGLVQTLDKWSYTIPVNKDSDPQSIEDIHALGFKIANGIIPPEWAVDYQIVRSNCLNIEMFIVGIVQNITFLTLDAQNTNTNPTSTTQEVRDAISGYFDNYNNGGSQYSIISRIIAAIRKNVEVNKIENCSLIYFDISNWVLDTITATSFPVTSAQSNISNSVYYNWQVGDRVRFWSNSAADYSGDWIQHDEEIINYIGTALIITKPANVGHMQQRYTVNIAPVSYPVLYAPNKQFTIEVYRPKKPSKTSDVIFYEMGEWYPVLYPGTGSRDFIKRDFTWGGSSQVSTITVPGPTARVVYSRFPIINGDVWSVSRNFFYSKVIYRSGGYIFIAQTGYLGPYVNPGGFTEVDDYPVFPQMTQDWANPAGVWEHNNGRPLVAYRYLPKQFNKSTQIRFGGKFLEDSLFIGINNFQEGNQFIYPSEYGPIRALCNVSNVVVKAVGNILLVMGEEQTWSVYVNRTTLEDLSGRSQVSLSDKVLGSFNTLLGSYGTLNPESVSRRNSRVIFWSQKQGKWIRYSDDGLTPISDNKMYNWFNDLSILLMNAYGTDDKPKVITVYDNYYSEWITYLSHSSLPPTFRGYASYKCVSFSEDDKRWKSFYDYAPELFAELENETYSIIGSGIYIHFAGTDFNSFYGVKKDTMWQPIANAEFRRMKIWQAVALEATDKWSFETIEGDYKSNGVNSQLTTLRLEDLTQIESVFWSDLKRDLNTPNDAGDNALNNGNVMRSKALTILLKLDPAVTWYSYLNWVMASYQVSQKTLKK